MLKYSRYYFVITQIGTPLSPDVGCVRKFLRKFLGSKRVIDIDSYFWKILFYFILIPFYPYRSAKKYLSLWQAMRFLNRERELPLLTVHTQIFAKKLQIYLSTCVDSELVSVIPAFLFNTPTLAEVWKKVIAPGIKESDGKVFILPQYPQY
ncbi:MAG: ferrochelatase, partial [Oligoflexia bacterium]|nr:ferrochelatase [Oligoflexia bacterium]